MRIFPSIPAAIVTGAVVISLFMRGGGIIEELFHNRALEWAWVILTLFAPFWISTVDFRFMAKRWRETGFFNPLASREDFQLGYFPAWKRMGVVVVSLIGSMILQTLLGQIWEYGIKWFL